MNPKAIQGERVLPQAQDENNKSIRIVSSSIVSKNVIISCIQNSHSIGTQTERSFLFENNSPNQIDSNKFKQKIFSSLISHPVSILKNDNFSIMNLCKNNEEQQQKRSINCLATKMANVLPLVFDFDCQLKENKVKELVKIKNFIFNKVDQIELSNQNISNTSLSNTSFICLFNDPTKLCIRTKINLSANRIATTADAAYDWNRCFVLLIDFIKALPGMEKFSVEDQIVITKARYPAFHWALCALWTLQIGITKGICYCNGSYFPRDPSLQCILVKTKCVERMFILLVEPLKQLQLSETEICLFYIIVIISSTITDLSNEKSKEQFSNLKQHYFSLLYNHIFCKIISNNESSKELTRNEASIQASVRAGHILILCSAITEMTHISRDNIQANNALQLFSMETWKIYQKII
ncbi:hypothetical protein Mgra_00005437 [Meloidogyne graminicola]|uniref:NR LBD domain-containing protein n=1 Tax=Meloidogyne graminicola TaxID=189291 RepID=A0A8S9ZNZ0_9BILA|nr:hypothetical protein Mgra_00005437 [Meloidogyne graminicola]